MAVLDAQVADRLGKTVAACRLMGAEVVLTGLSIENAGAVADLGWMDGAGCETAVDLQSGTERAERLVRMDPRG